MRDSQHPPRGNIRALLEFLSVRNLTASIADLEHELEAKTAAESVEIVSRAGLTPVLMRDAIIARSQLGRLSDLIHASAISLVLERVLEPDETIVVRPSLAAGNDPSRPFDLETDRRVAEFKLAMWKGADAMRKRQVLKDLVALSLDTTPRRKQLFVIGSSPARFLRSTRATCDWGLNRSSPKLRQRFVEAFGPLDLPIPEFVRSHGSRVEIIDLTELAPDLFSDLTTDSDIRE